MKYNRIIHGDVIKNSMNLEKESIQTIITSPPYFGLRKYGKSLSEKESEIGREKEVDSYINHLVQVFEHLKPALKKDGIVNI